MYANWNDGYARTTDLEKPLTPALTCIVGHILRFQTPCNEQETRQHSCKTQALSPSEVQSPDHSFIITTQHPCIESTKTHSTMTGRRRWSCRAIGPRIPFPGTKPQLFHTGELGVMHCQKRRTANKFFQVQIPEPQRELQIFVDLYQSPDQISFSF